MTQPAGGIAIDTTWRSIKATTSNNGGRRKSSDFESLLARVKVRTNAESNGVRLGVLFPERRYQEAQVQGRVEVGRLRRSERDHAKAYHTDLLLLRFAAAKSDLVIADEAFRGIDIWKLRKEVREYLQSRICPKSIADLTDILSEVGCGNQDFRQHAENRFLLWWQQAERTRHQKRMS